MIAGIELRERLNKRMKQMHYSPGLILGHITWINRFLRWLDRNEPEPNGQDVENYLLYLAGQGVSCNTQSSVMEALRLLKEVLES